jgi:hypothetical protein
VSFVAETETDSYHPKIFEVAFRQFFRDVQSKRTSTEWKMIKSYAV